MDFKAHVELFYRAIITNDWNIVEQKREFLLKHYSLIRIRGYVQGKFWHNIDAVLSDEKNGYLTDCELTLIMHLLAVLDSDVELARLEHSRAFMTYWLIRDVLDSYKLPNVSGYILDSIPLLYFAITEATSNGQIRHFLTILDRHKKTLMADRRFIKMLETAPLSSDFADYVTIWRWYGIEIYITDHLAKKYITNCKYITSTMMVSPRCGQSLRNFESVVMLLKLEMTDFVLDMLDKEKFCGIYANVDVLDIFNKVYLVVSKIGLMGLQKLTRTMVMSSTMHDVCKVFYNIDTFISEHPQFSASVVNRGYMLAGLTTQFIVESHHSAFYDALYTYTAKKML